MLVDFSIEGMKFQLVVPTGSEMNFTPRLVHCILCGHLWFAETEVPDACANCKMPGYAKFPMEFDYHSSPCSICRFEYDIYLATQGEAPRIKLRRKESWQPHSTPLELLRKFFKGKAA